MSLQVKGGERRTEIGVRVPSCLAVRSAAGCDRSMDTTSKLAVRQPPRALTGEFSTRDDRDSTCAIVASTRDALPGHACPSSQSASIVPARTLREAQSLNENFGLHDLSLP